MRAAALALHLYRLPVRTVDALLPILDAAPLRAEDSWWKTFLPQGMKNGVERRARLCFSCTSPGSSCSILLTVAVLRRLPLVGGGTAGRCATGRTGNSNRRHATACVFRRPRKTAPLPMAAYGISTRSFLPHTAARRAKRAFLLRNHRALRCHWLSTSSNGNE